MKDRAILWVFLAFILGFALPVCGCVGTGLLTLSALSRLAGEPAPTTVGCANCHTTRTRTWS